MINTIPVKPHNPSDSERHGLLMDALIKENRLYDFENIIKYLSPPPDITNWGQPGEFRNIKVGIIGGGLAGMSAAFELRKLSFDITIFEPRTDHIGGRVYTYRFDEDRKLYGELGAMRIPVSHETSWHYINTFKLDTVPFIEYDPNTLIYVRGVLVKNTPENIMKYIYPRFSLTPIERKTPWLILSRYTPRAALSCIPPEIRPEILQILPRYSPQYEYLTQLNQLQVMQLFRLSGGAVSLITSVSPVSSAIFYNGYGETLSEQYALSFTDLYRLADGMDMLPRAFHTSLTSNDPLEYRHIPQNLLGKVHWKSGSWVIGIYRSGDQKVILRYTDTFERIGTDEQFDYVICALPLSELREIDIKPLFACIKMQAIRVINYIDSQKTIFLCSERFWEKGNTSSGIKGGSSFTDMLIQSTVYPSDSDSCASHGSKPISGTNRPGVLTASYNYGLDSVRLGTMEKAERFTLIKRQVEELHSLPYRYLDDIVMDNKSVEWNNELRFSGAFTSFMPDQRIRFFYEISRPEYDNRIFFAGEHTSPKHGWMQGALHSGMLAANDIVYACRQNLRK